MMSNEKQEDKKAVGVFELLYTCKHSVRYKPTNENAKTIASAIYLNNETVNAFGKPDNILVEVSPIINL